MKFVDEALLEVQAGDGGDGMISFRREKYVPRGGPDGGNGGVGGHVIFRGDEGTATLLDVRNKRFLKAQKGANGGSKNKHGRKGADEILRLPVGTLVYEEDSGRLVGEILAHQEELIVAQGGDGGKGNAHFMSSIKRAPRRATEGYPGEFKKLRLELKLLADVALIGRPNAGKSTFISTVTAAKAKVADYPFTTLNPQLGVVKVNYDFSFTLADIPGLIEGASEGHGMGIQFLRHIERTKVFLHLLDPFDPEFEDPMESFKGIEEELFSYNANFRDRPRWILLTKCELFQDEKEKAEMKILFESLGFPVYFISSLSRIGLNEVLTDLGNYLQKIKEKDETIS